MNISFVFPEHLGEARQFLLQQTLTEAATNLQHQIVALDQADLILLFDKHVPAELVGKLGAVVDFEQLLEQPAATLQHAVASAQPLQTTSTSAANTTSKNIVAVTACPTGVAQTFMSAEAIANYAKSQGWNVKIETRGQIGANNLITEKEVQEADLVFIAADIDVDLSKFEGKRIYRTSTKLALKQTAQEFENAFKQATLYQSQPRSQRNENAPQACSTGQCKPCQFSRFLPWVLAAGATIIILSMLLD